MRRRGKKEHNRFRGAHVIYANPNGVPLREHANIEVAIENNHPSKTPGRVGTDRWLRAIIPTSSVHYIADILNGR